MNYAISKFAILISILLFGSYTLRAQQELAGAKVVRGEDGSVIVTSDSIRPLRFALLALTETYGWVVDYEDPIYSQAETQDSTDAEWLRQHPEGRHVYSPVSGSFTANLGKVDDGNPNELALVGKLVELYNNSANPGQFQLVHTSNGRLVVTGRSRFEDGASFTPVLNRQMHPSREAESAAKAVQDLAAQCGSAGATRVELGILPANALATSIVQGYEGFLTCREQLERILGSLGHSAEYMLLYDVSTHAYYLSITAAHRLVIGPDGKLTVAPL